MSDYALCLDIRMLSPCARRGERTMSNDAHHAEMTTHGRVQIQVTVQDFRGSVYRQNRVELVQKFGGLRK
jgi:hypothetical protein